MAAMTAAPNGIVVQPIDYTDPAQGNILVDLLDGYAHDPMGGGDPLHDDVKRNLPSRLASIPHAFSLVAYVDKNPAGLINCFEGFSTFAARPLVNVHDLYVDSAYRGRGVGKALLQAAEDEARRRECCKVTIECLSGNDVALGVYKKFGFAAYELDPEKGRALFMEKKLN